MRGFNISEWAIRHAALTRYLLVVLLLGGVFAYFQLGQNEDPEFTFRVMVVSSRLPGATARQVEEQLTDRIERKLQETPYVDKIRSYSKPGESLIFVVLLGSVPPKEVAGIWYQVRKKVGDIRNQLPAGTQGPFFNDEFGDTYGSLYAFSADGFSYHELKDYVDYARQQLLHVPFVAKVELFGVQDEKVFVEFSHKKFAQMGIGIEQVIAALNAQNVIEPAGTLITPESDLQVRVSGQFRDERDLENLVLRVPGNSNAFRLGDFATVTRAYAEPPVQKMRFNGKEVIGVGVSMAKGGDIVKLGLNLEQAMAKIRNDLPVGIEVAQVADQPRVVKRSVGEFLRTLSEAVLIVLAVSFLSLGLHRHPLRVDMRPGLVVALTIPLVLAVTFLCMWVFGIDFQKISLGALIIALGLLVDDAIIVVEMMVRKLEEGYERLEAATFAYRSTAMPMLTGTLITVAGFLPVGIAKSVAGEYTFSIFAVNAIALITSWIAAVFFTPYIGFLLLNEKPPAGGPHDPFDTPGYRRFRALVDWCVDQRKTVIVITLVVFALGIFGFRFIQQQFFPDSNREELNVELWLPEGAGFAASEREARRFEAFLQREDVAPDVVNYVTYVGTGSPRFFLPLDQQLTHANFAQIFVLTKDVAARERVREKMKAVFAAEFPDVRGRVNLLPNGPPVAYPVQFRVKGPDAALVRKYADQVKDVMRADPNTVGVNDNWNEQIKVLRLDLDQDKARALGVSSQTLARAAQTVLTGTTIGTFREGDRLIDIVMRQPERERSVIDRLYDANIPTGNGRSVPLSQLARGELVWEPGIIWRQGREPTITVQSEVKDGIQGPHAAMLIDPKLDDIRRAMQPGYRIEIAGAIEESKSGQDSINANMPLLVVIILTLLMLQLHSFQRSLLVFLTAPLGIIGAALALIAFQAPFGFVATLGVIALAGMIMRNSVILIDQIEQDIAAGRTRWDAIVGATVRRFRPIMLTAAAAILAMIPLTRSIFWGPMAMAIMGGLLVATVLTLLFLPALYAAWFRVRRDEPAPAAPSPADSRPSAAAADPAGAANI